MNLQLIIEDGYMVLIDKDAKISKEDYFINLNMDETYFEVDKFLYEDFKKYADEEWTQNCFKVLAYRHLIQREGAIEYDLPKLPMFTRYTDAELEAEKVYREVVKYGMIEDLPSNSQWVKGVFRKGFEFSQALQVKDFIPIMFFPVYDVEECPETCQAGLEHEQDCYRDGCINSKQVMKTTTNSEGEMELLGNYFF